MTYRVEVTTYFKKQAKRLFQKYPSLNKEIELLIDTLSINPVQGTPLGKGCYKIRVAIASKGKGKSGGARVITHVQISETKVFILSIYDKSEITNLSQKELVDLMRLRPE